MPPTRRSSKYAIQGDEALELACSSCPTVLQVNHSVGDDLPRHRCAGTGRPADFDIVMQLDGVLGDDQSKRIDAHWYGEHAHTDY